MPASSSLRQQRRVAALDHVGEQRRGAAELLGNFREIVARARRLDEKDIGARLGIEPPALDRTVEILDRGGVGTADDQRLPATAARRPRP